MNSNKIVALNNSKSSVSNPISKALERVISKRRKDYGFILLWIKIRDLHLVKKTKRKLKH